MQQRPAAYVAYAITREAAYPQHYDGVENIVVEVLIAGTAYTFLATSRWFVIRKSAIQ